MEDDIDYGELFGVGGPEDRRDGRWAVDRPPDQSLSQRDNDGPQPNDVPEQSTDVPPSGQDQAAGVPNSDTGGEPQGQEPIVPGSGTAEQAPVDNQEGPPREPSEAGRVGEGGVRERVELSPQAEAERRALYDDAVAKAQADAQRTIDEAFARSRGRANGPLRPGAASPPNGGLKNPYTGAPITTKAEYDAYKAQFDAERREKILKQTGMSGEEFQQFVQGLPEVQQAREAQEAAEKAVRETREAAARVKVEEQIREISQLDPSIKSLEDLPKMPNYARFYALVKVGNTLVDAYRLANFEALTQSAAAGARQAAVNAARGKEHLEQTRTRGRGAVSVPAEVKEQYRFFNPGATDEEIQQHYQRNHKEG